MTKTGPGTLLRMSQPKSAVKPVWTKQDEAALLAFVNAKQDLSALELKRMAALLAKRKAAMGA